jgi:hypothetical protein
MGMRSAFGSSADFSNMTPGNVFISQVRHKAFLEMDENGAEATAATAVHLALCFVAGTLVLTPEGTKPIEQIKAGDFVLSRDQYDVSGKIEPKRVEVISNGHGELVSLHIGGQIFRATKEHPFFVNGKGWTAAGELRPGDLLATDVGKWLEVEHVGSTGERGPVHNFRVADHHTYFVTGKASKFAVWTHNEYEPKFLATSAFHFLIRDNTTDTFLFMGRIDDPRQAENDLEPNYIPPDVSALQGDYNLDGTVDAADYVVWRATLGDTVAAFSGADGNGNGVIDQPDRQIWQTNFGAAMPSRASAVAAALPAEPADSPAGQVGVASAVDSALENDARFGLVAMYTEPRGAAMPTSPRLAPRPSYQSGRADLLLALASALHEQTDIESDTEAIDAALAAEHDEIDFTGTDSGSRRASIAANALLLSW